MLETNVEGLTPEAEQKTIHPYAHNTGKRIDLAEAGRQALALLKEDPNLLDAVGDLLERPAVDSQSPKP